MNIHECITIAVILANSLTRLMARICPHPDRVSFARTDSNASGTFVRTGNRTDRPPVRPA